MFATLSRLLSGPARRTRPSTARLSAELLEGRDVPATFVSYGGNPLPYEGLAVVQPLTPVDTDGDPSNFEQVTFTFRDLDPDREVVYLAVFNKFDGSVPPNVDPAKQTLLTFDRVQTTGLVGQEYTLTAFLPKCGFQVDAVFAPGGLSAPVADLDGAYNLEGAIGSNDCPDFALRTQGYWKNHAEAWPVGALSIGDRTYTRDELLAILRTSVQGNGAISLAHQLIAAKLNLAAGGDPSDAVMQAVRDADRLIGSINLTAAGRSRGANWLAPSATSALTSLLDNFNNGRSV